MKAAAAHEARTAAALAARRRTTQDAIGRVHHAIGRLRSEKVHVSVAGVARRPGVSRSFLYANPEARAAIATAAAEAGEHRSRRLADQDDERQATWCERALNTEDALKAAYVEIATQRTRIGELLGQIRDLQAEWTEDAIQRITTETLRSSSASGNSPPTTGPSTNGSRPPAPTCASSIAAQPNSKLNSSTEQP